MADKLKILHKTLNAKKEMYFTRMQRLFETSQNLDNEAAQRNFIISFHTIEETKSLFFSVIDDINTVSLQLDENFVPNFQPLDAFNDLYCSIVYAHKTIIAVRNGKDTEPGTGPPRSTPRLPKLTIPTFDGSPENWTMFQECFKTLVHENSSLTDVDKVHYLVGSLKGRALSTCSGIPPTGENYLIMWQILLDKYQDERLLANSYMDIIMNTKTSSHETVNSLNNFLEKFDTSVQALKKLKLTDVADFIFSYLAIKKLHPDTIKLFENSRQKLDIPSYADVIDFVKMQAKILERNTGLKGVAHSSVEKFTKSKTNSFVVQNSFKSKCPVCDKPSHDIYHCEKFERINPLERYQLVKQHRLCLNCLGSHKIKYCKSTMSCTYCKLKHHSLLHFNQPGVSTSVTSPIAMQSSSNKQNIIVDTPPDNSKFVNSSYSSPLSLCSTMGPTSRLDTTILLATALVNVVDSQGMYQKARFLIDSASQANFVSHKLCKRLKLPVLTFQSSVQGIGNISSTVKGQTQMVVLSCVNVDIKYSIDALVVDKITDKLPESQVNTNGLSYLKKLPLADETFACPGEIDGILGAQMFPIILRNGRIKNSGNSPVAIETTLGYIIMGTAPIEAKSNQVQAFCTFTETSLEKVVHKFWELEEVPHVSQESPDDLECERLYKESCIRDSSGRYTVALPFKTTAQLGNSRAMAMRRFYSLEKKLISNLVFHSQYNEIIRDYLKQNHMARVENSEDSSGYYIPHHAIYKDSVSTPIRIVFDASAKTDSNFSLNDILYTGPKLQPDLVTMLLNFRLFEVAFTADIRQMYRQINIIPEHRPFQRLVYRFSPNDPLSTYELTTVSFGVKSSPYLALRTIQQLAIDENTNFPVASNIVKDYMYVDDLICSMPNLKESIEAYNQLVNLFEAGGFSLVKWTSNSKKLLESIPEDKRLADLVSFESESSKVLGIHWQPSVDSFVFEINLPAAGCTKRTILSTIAQFFDPLGLFAPVILVAKLIIQTLWSLRLGWDEVPPTSILDKWDQYKLEFPQLKRIRIPRYLGASTNSQSVLVGFADACETSYGACVYIKIVDNNGKVHTGLLSAKTKVSPLKTVSIPRLELCAALLLAKLLEFVKSTYSTKLNIQNIYACSDSTVTLSWIMSSPHVWKTFVSNRVAKIQHLVASDRWYHIEGKLNPADSLSRGVTPLKFVQGVEWITGPPWLKHPENQWPLTQHLENKTLLEQKIVTLVVANPPQHFLYPFIEKFSKWLKLVRSTVYFLRFIKHLPRDNICSVNDLSVAENYLIKIIQCNHFSRDIQSLKNGGEPSNLTRKLRPFIDSFGILRVGGRLHYANLEPHVKHPILLPKHDHLVQLIIGHYHTTNLHTGPNLLLALLRQRFWILGGRGLVRQYVQKCNFCFRRKPKPVFPLMGNLPKLRVEEAKPFLNTAVDYAGPIEVCFSRVRGVRTHKAYICLFVCLATKAIHVELASDLSTHTFLQAFKRFISRRGVVSTIVSDNGTNFVGARAVLNELYMLLNSDQHNNSMTNELAAQKITWNLNPPHAPHFNGISEANVKSVKTCLYKVLGTQILTYEELNTLLIQIEALLNSRPIAVMSSDPSELLPLTPGHFLTFSPLKELPASDVTHIKVNRLDRYQLIDQMVQNYWNRWRLEYLTALQHRERWNTSSNPITIGTVVVLIQPSVPPLKWPLGIIIQVYPGASDGIVRVVLVKTKRGEFRRPVVKVCPLPTQ